MDSEPRGASSTQIAAASRTPPLSTPHPGYPGERPVACRNPDVAPITVASTNRLRSPWRPCMFRSLQSPPMPDNCSLFACVRRSLPAARAALRGSRQSTALWRKAPRFPATNTPNGADKGQEILRDRATGGRCAAQCAQPKDQVRCLKDRSRPVLTSAVSIFRRSRAAGCRRPAGLSNRQPVDP